MLKTKFRKNSVKEKLVPPKTSRRNNRLSPIVVLLSGAGGVLVSVAYILESLILTFAGIALIFWGVLIYINKPSSSTRGDIVFTIPLSAIKTLSSVVSALNYKGSSIFFFSQILHSDNRAYLFVGAEDKQSSLPSGNLISNNEELPLTPKVSYDQELTTASIFSAKPKGIRVLAPMVGVVEFFEKELSVSFDRVDMHFVQANLPKLLVEELGLLRDLEIQYEETNIITKITDQSLASICDSISKETSIKDHAMCPVCGTFAVIFSKVTGKPISISSSNAMKGVVETSYSIVDVEIE